MNVAPNDGDRALAKEIYARFTSRPGSKHIANEFALAHLCAVLRTKRPESVLEFGTGIGTITYLLLVHPDGPQRVTCTEDHPFCLEQLEANIPSELRQRLDLVTTEAGLEQVEGEFELVIFDGKYSDPGRSRFFGPGSVCFVEGSRRSTRRDLDESLSKYDLACHFDNFNRGVKPLALVWRKSKTLGLPYPKLKRNKVIKGCWVGEVQALTN